MQIIKIKNEQCFIDIVLESTGSIDNVLQMALANNTSITDERVIGSDYKVSAQVNNKVVNVMRVHTPATGLRNHEQPFNYRLPHLFPMF